jgi:hypothetical protein
MDALYQILNDPAAQGSLYVTFVLLIIQFLKTYVVPAPWWTGPHEDKLRLLPLVFGVAAHLIFDSLPWKECFMPGLQDGFIALGIFNGTKIVRKLGGG